MSRREYCLRTATGRKALNSPLVPSATGLLGSMNKLLPCWRYSARTLMRLWTLKKSRNACAPLRGIIRAFFKKCSHLLLSFGKPADNMASDPLGESLTRTLRYFRYVVLWSTRPLITSLESLLARSSISTQQTQRPHTPRLRYGGIPTCKSITTRFQESLAICSPDSRNLSEVVTTSKTSSSIDGLSRIPKLWQYSFPSLGSRSPYLPLSTSARTCLLPPRKHTSCTRTRGPNPSLKRSANGMSRWPSSAGPAAHFALVVQRATPSSHA